MPQGIPRPFRAAALRQDVVQLRFFNPGADSQGDQIPGSEEKGSRGYLPGGRFTSLGFRRFRFRPGIPTKNRFSAAALAAHEGRKARARVVPIVADEARSFAAALFRQFAVYSALGPGSTSPRTTRSCSDGYREVKTASRRHTYVCVLSSWLAAATSYSSHGMPMPAVSTSTTRSSAFSARRPDLAADAFPRPAASSSAAQTWRTTLRARACSTRRFFVIRRIF